MILKEKFSHYDNAIQSALHLINIPAHCNTTHSQILKTFKIFYSKLPSQ